LTSISRFAPANLNKQPDIPGYDSLIEAITQDDESRSSFMKACLTKLGLEVSQTGSVPSLSRVHLSALVPSEVDELLHSCGDIITKEDGEEFIHDMSDVFHIEKPDLRWSMTTLDEALDDTAGLDKNIDYSKIVKRVVTHENAWPEPKETPYFNHAVLYSSLREYREKDRDANDWGNIFMYGEVLTSTNTILEK
jgi:biotin--protein ligase